MVTVWGGDPECSHVWGDEISQRQRGTAHGAGAQCGNTLAEVAPTIAKQGAFCALCGAWRGSLGLEPDWRLYIGHLLECAKEWWRVLKKSGSLVINIGDTFAGSQCGQHDRRRDWSISQPELYDKPAPQARASIPKMKLGIPYRLRFVLNDMGFISREDVIWYKGKEYEDHISKVAMPESARRLACSYEMVFFFAKTHKMNYYVHEKTGECRTRPPSKRIEGVDFEWVPHDRCGGKGCEMKRCHDGMVKKTFWHGYDRWFDLDAIRQPHQPQSIERHKYGGLRKPRSWGEEECPISGGDPTWYLGQGGANPGDVFVIPPETFRGEHYATFPSELCRRVISVACPKEACPECGKPRERITMGRSEHAFGLREREAKTGRIKTPPERYWGGALTEEEASKYNEREYGGEGKQTIGWSDCGCGEGFSPGVVLDPFGGGSGRLAREAMKLGRRFIGVDLKEDYLEMSRECILYGEREYGREVKRRKQGIRQELLL